jgi:hypothetical protein
VLESTARRFTPVGFSLPKDPKKRPQRGAELGPNFRSAGEKLSDTILTWVHNQPDAIKFSVSFHFVGVPSATCYGAAASSASHLINDA